ncbi:VanZ family protein [Candidatus Pacearchaeota archaeon]|nr:VanZ family protein [Candidatus Pacearchaeota archaeon]
MIKWFERHSFFAWFMALGMAIFIFYISGLTFEAGVPGKGIPYKSYMYHFTIFAIFSFFLLIAIIRGKIDNRYLVLFAILLALAYSITDEIHQFFVPNRFCSYTDIITNSVGILASSVFYLILRKK